MQQDEHYRRLESMYAAAPVNRIYQPTMVVSDGEAVITMELTESLHHSGGAAHGSVYFKMLDDAAFFAANSREVDVFVLTTSFTTYLTRPVSVGCLRSVGRVVNQNSSQFICEAVVYDAEDREIGRGNGIFVRSRWPLASAKGYGES